MKHPNKDAPLLELVHEALREQRTQVWIQAVPPGSEEHEDNGAGETGHAAHDQAWPGAPAQERETVQLVQGRTYQGTGNLADRAFHAESPDMLWVTDLMEFSIPADKAYLSPVIDCCDGMLTDACSTLKDGERPVIHFDRGCRYRWPEWIRIRKGNSLTRSMSAKGCSPDNAAAEGFLGRLKQESFHKQSFVGVSMDGFIGMLDDHMVWYRDKRIKMEFGISIMDRRRKIGLVA